MPVSVSSFWTRSSDQAHAVGCLSLPAAGQGSLRAAPGLRHAAEQLPLTVERSGFFSLITPLLISSGLGARGSGKAGGFAEAAVQIHAAVASDYRGFPSLNPEPEPRFDHLLYAAGGMVNTLRTISAKAPAISASDTFSTARATASRSASGRPGESCGARELLAGRGRAPVTSLAETGRGRSPGAGGRLVAVDDSPLRFC